MEQHTLTVAAHRLGVSPFTLRQWCKAAAIDLEDQVSRADPRQKWVTDAQLKQLAREHGRVLDQPPAEPEPIPPNAYKLLLEQTAQAAQEAEQIRADHQELQEEQEQLRSDLAAIQQAAEHYQQQQEQTGAALVEIRATLEETAASLEEDRQELAKHTTELEAQRDQTQRLEQQQAQLRADFGKEEQKRIERQAQLRADLDMLTAGYQELAASLVTLSTRSDKQGQKHAQLMGRVEALETQAQQAQAQLEAMQEQLQQSQKAMKAEFDAALHVLRQEMRAERERDKSELAAAIQHAEQTQARAIEQFTNQQEKQDTQLEQIRQQAATAEANAQAASVAAQGSRSRLEALEQRLAIAPHPGDQAQPEQAAPQEQPPKRKPGRPRKGQEPAPKPEQ
jgi:myosin heavy subunit